MKSCTIKVGDIYAHVYELGSKFIVRWQWFGVTDKIICNNEADAYAEYRKKAEAIYALLDTGRN